MIIARWAPWFRQLYGGVLPKDYCAWDLESSGFSRKDDVIVEWGHCLVHDGKAVDRLGLLVNWYLTPEVIRPEYITNQLHRVAQAMRMQGRTWAITPERLQDEGTHPKKAIKFIYEYLVELQKQDMMLVTHNGWNFDVAMLLSHFAQDLGIDTFEFHPNRMIDTGAIVKASQMMDLPKSLPQAGEDMRTYFRRVMHCHAPGVNWNLDGYCVKAYGLAEQLDADTMHSASTDAYALHLLMEKFRVLAEAQERTDGGISKLMDTKTLMLNGKDSVLKPVPLPAGWLVVVSGNAQMGDRFWDSNQGWLPVKDSHSFLGINVAHVQCVIRKDAVPEPLGTRTAGPSRGTMVADVTGMPIYRGQRNR